MDKVKQILEVLRKHHFWILCGLAALVGVIVWQMSTSGLDAEFQKDSRYVDEKLKSVQAVNRDESMARENWKGLKEKETETLKEEVGKRWQELYAEQKKEVFKWLDNLSAEDVAKLEAPGEYERPLIDTYTEAIRSAPEQLTKIVGAPPPEAIPGGVGSAPAAAAAGGQYKVSWSSESLDTIRQSFDWVTPATALIVRQAQEEFWVYKALCDVIAKVNGTAAGNEVPIKQILDMKIAYLAVEDSSGGSNGSEKRIDSIVQAAGADPAAPAPAAQGDTPTAAKPVLKDRLKVPNTGGPLFGGPDAGGAGGKPDDLWKRFRYVKTTNPLASTGDPIREPAEYDEAVKSAKYLLMPFDLELSIDDRYADRLLVAMRNSVLPLEVQQVRINPVNANMASMGYGGGGGGGGADHGGGMTPLIAQQMANRGGPAGGAAGQVATSRYITVELRGVAYILTPPNLQKASESPAGTAPVETAANTAAVNGP
jgi:hypothetical protein